MADEEGVILLIGCNKGGAGKSTLAVSCCIPLANQGTVMLVCADSQPSAYTWAGDRAEHGYKPEIARAQLSGNITKDLYEYKKHYDYVIVDVPGRNSRELVTAMFAADILIAPHQCSQFDLDTISELQEQVVRARDHNPDLKAYLYQSMASTHVKVRDNEREDFEEIAKDFPELTLLETIGYYRRAYKQVVAEGKGVTEHENVEAGCEICDLLYEVGL